MFGIRKVPYKTGQATVLGSEVATKNVTAAEMVWVDYAVEVQPSEGSTFRSVLTRRRAWGEEMIAVGATIPVRWKYPESVDLDARGDPRFDFRARSSVEQGKLDDVRRLVAEPPGSPAPSDPPIAEI
ncbi:MAG TPA: hypothetical protein VMU77_01540 [Acidimicrobiales bacterium]|nr:hypothetical protein [Acidimicrobiales bacterium]